MPIKIPDNLPAKEVLTNENIFIMDENRAYHQDIRPLKIGILNLMPTKIVTETQLLRMLGNTPLQVEIDLLYTKSHDSKNTPKEHLSAFYKTFDDVKDNKYDGLIITGAPVEHIDFREVSYWTELKDIMEWSVHNVFSTFHICWAAQAGLYYHYGVGKHAVEKKIFGVFKHRVNDKKVNLLRGFDDVFYAPHSRHTDIDKRELEKIAELKILAESDEAGIYIIKSEGGRQIFVTGHSEYDSGTLKNEYFRDKDKGLDIDIPKNYFHNDDPNSEPIVIWRSHGAILFANWLNYYVYQETPYDLSEIK